MTREEAIEVIKAYRDKLTNSASNQLDGDIEAFDMAIKALSQEPCDDAVSRADFEAHLFENYCVPVSKIGKPNQYSSGCFYKDVVKCLDELPSVTQKPKTDKPKADELCEKCGYRSGNLCVRPKDYICKALLPSVTPSRRKGHWIETEYHRWKCSVCREKGMSEWDNIHDVRTNFCPNCGVKMESEEQTE